MPKGHVVAPWETVLRNKLRSNRHKKVASITIGTPLQSEFYAIQIRAHKDFTVLLSQACRLRNINRGSYLRRAVVQVMAKDLHLHPLDILALTPYPREGKPGPNNGRVDDGTDFASWCPHPGCEGEHLVTRPSNPENTEEAQ